MTATAVKEAERRKMRKRIQSQLIATVVVYLASDDANTVFAIVFGAVVPVIPLPLT